MAFDYAGAPTSTRYDSFTGRFTTAFCFSGWFLTPATWPINPYVFANQTNFFFYFANVGGGTIGVGFEQDFTGGYADYLFPLPATGSVVHIAVRWDMSDGANVPRVWYDGVEQTATVSNAQSGTTVAGTAQFRWHGATFSATQTAMYAVHDVLVWDALVSVDQLLAASRGAPVSHINRAALMFDLPEQLAVVDRSPNQHAMTLVGTAPTRVLNNGGVSRRRRR